MKNKRVNIDNFKYGIVNIKLKELLKKSNITRYELEKITGITYKTINRYYNNKIVKADLEIIAKFCYVLNCEISDLIEYKNK